ncbi:MAG: DUF2339 domain-containing protein, partial [Gammaproteobacteria bacterium]
AQSFAVFAVTGGFLAPILASTGNGNYVVLFTYYLVLDIVILLVSRYRSWRLLNLVGFAFTFIIATAWGVLEYSPAKFFLSEIFLLAFFLIYVIVAILYAGKGTLKIHKPLDATLLLANPLVTFALQAGLVYQYEYGLAFSALGFGVFYLLLARLLWNRAGEDTRLLTEVFVALGVVFASLAIPFALDAQISAAAWAVEGAGVLWIATRQGQLYAKYFALVLLTGASLLFLSDAQTGLHGGSNLFSTFILGTSLIGLAWLFSGWLLRAHKDETPRPAWEVTVSKLLLAGGLLWWLGGALLRFFSYLPDLDAANLWMLYLSISTALLFLLSQRYDWRDGCLASLAQFPGLLLMLAWFLSHEAHPLVSWSVLTWPLGIAMLYWLMKMLEKGEGEEGLHPVLHVIAFYLVLFVLLWEGRYQLTRHFTDDSAWVIAWYAVPLIAGLRFILHWTRWPMNADAQAYGRIIPLSLIALFALWAFGSSLSPGDAAPLRDTHTSWLPAARGLLHLDQRHIASRHASLVRSRVGPRCPARIKPGTDGTLDPLVGHRCQHDGNREPYQSAYHLASGSGPARCRRRQAVPCRSCSNRHNRPYRLFPDRRRLADTRRLPVATAAEERG